MTRGIGGITGEVETNDQSESATGAEAGSSAQKKGTEIISHAYGMTAIKLEYSNKPRGSLY